MSPYAFDSKLPGFADHPHALIIPTSVTLLNDIHLLEPIPKILRC